MERDWVGWLGPIGWVGWLLPTVRATLWGLRPLCERCCLGANGALVRALTRERMAKRQGGEMEEQASGRARATTINRLAGAADGADDPAMMRLDLMRNYFGEKGPCVRHSTPIVGSWALCPARPTLYWCTMRE